MLHSDGLTPSFKSKAYESCVPKNGASAPHNVHEPTTTTEENMTQRETYRVVSREPSGNLRIHDYHDKKELLSYHNQIGVDDCSTNLELRGEPVCAGLIGPMLEEGSILRYETPDVFEALTKEWGDAGKTTSNVPRRRNRGR